MADSKITDSKRPDKIFSAADEAQVNTAKLKAAKALAGLPALLQGMVLADLLSMWVAAHFVCDETGTTDVADTASLREQLLQEHIGLARDLVPLYEQELNSGEVEVEVLVESNDASTRH